MNIFEKSLLEEVKNSQLELKEPDSLVFGNRKTGQAFRSLLKFCKNRTPICEKYCYACRSHISWGHSIRKSIAVRRWIKKHGIEASAKRMASEIYWKGTFRFLDRGELDPLLLKLINRLSILRSDVAFNVYSRNLLLLKRITQKVSRVYSIDESSATKAQSIPKNIKIAYLKTLPHEKIPDCVDVVFPLNHRKALLGHAKDCNFYKRKNVTCQSCMRCF